MKILLLGGSGQLGTELRRSLAPLAELVVTTRDGALADGARAIALDLSDPGSIAPLVFRLRPDVVVNATAYTAVDRAEEQSELAYRVNAEAPKRLVAACVAHDAALVHYSTDYVFDGTATRPYREDDPTSPLGVYGASKLAGEAAIGDSGARHLILRTAWIYATHSQNFLRTMLRVGAQRDELRVVADQVGSPTPAWLIADVTATILAQGIGQSRVRHLVAGGQVTWFGFAEAIFAQAVLAGLIDRVPRVVPITTAEYPTPAQRPAYSVLDTSLLQAEYGISIPDWRQALHDTLATRQT